jgi:hypothetical protein
MLTLILRPWLSPTQLSLVPRAIIRTMRAEAARSS